MFACYQHVAGNLIFSKLHLRLGIFFLILNGSYYIQNDQPLFTVLII